jgi:uncharacterized protein (DUF2141 family)
MKAAATTLALAVTLVTAVSASGQQPAPTPSPAPKVDLVVHVVGFKHTRGRAIAKLFVPGDDVMGPGRAMAKADIHGSEATLSFPGLAPGSYAVIAFHDENDNGTLDHGMFGPAEPLGGSNGVGHGFGPPSFDKLKFQVGPKSTRIEVAVR